MLDLLPVVLVAVLLVPVMALVVRLPDHLGALFAGRRDGFLFGIGHDDAWPRGVQEELEPGFRWVPPASRDDTPATAAVIARTVRRRREEPNRD
jgi:hypothetical protein